MFNSIQFINSYNPIEVLIELAVIWICVFLIFRFLRGTRGAGVVKGFAVLIVLLTLGIRVIGQGSGFFSQLNFIYDRFLGLLAILLIVVFQPELRQVMIRLGHSRLFGGSHRNVNTVLQAIDETVRFLCKSQFGAIIAIERTIKLGGLVDSGQELDAKVSARLLETIFWPNSPLHDLGVVIRDDRVVAAGVQFPLVEEGVLLPRYGSRHRAGVGLTMETDAIVIIVSEETATVSIAEEGRIQPDIPLDSFLQVLSRSLAAKAPEMPKATAPDPETAPASTSAGEDADDKEAA